MNNISEEIDYAKITQVATDQAQHFYEVTWNSLLHHLSLIVTLGVAASTIFVSLIIYLMQQQTKKEIDNRLKAIEEKEHKDMITVKDNSLISRGVTFYNLGTVSFRLKDPDNALIYFLITIATYLRVSDINPTYIKLSKRMRDRAVNRLLYLFKEYPQSSFFVYHQPMFNGLANAHTISKFIYEKNHGWHYGEAQDSYLMTIVSLSDILKKEFSQAIQEPSELVKSEFVGKDQYKEVITLLLSRVTGFDQNAVTSLTKTLNGYKDIDLK